jgi:hypothetical protein
MTLEVKFWATFAALSLMLLYGLHCTWVAQ